MSPGTYLSNVIARRCSADGLSGGGNGPRPSAAAYRSALNPDVKLRRWAAHA